MNVIQQALQQGRDRITAPGTWIKGRLRAIQPDGTIACCALGAFISGSGCIMDRSYDTYQESIGVVFSVLERRYFQGILPEATVGQANGKPIAWEHLFKSPRTLDLRTLDLMEKAVSQFNNSTSHEEVLALFDEAIADAADKQPATQVQEIISMTPESVA